MNSSHFQLVESLNKRYRVDSRCRRVESQFPSAGGTFFEWFVTDIALIASAGAHFNGSSRIDRREERMEVRRALSMAIPPYFVLALPV